MNVRDNWRLVLLGVLLVLSAFALFVPGAPVEGGEANNATAEASFTNLQYGIQLDGGSQVRAPPVGITAEGVEVPATEETATAQSIADRLEIDPIDVRAANQSNTIEVFSKNVSHDEFRSVLEGAGYAPETIRDGVTDETMSNLVDRVDEKLTESALTRTKVYEARSIDRQILVVEAVDQDSDEIERILENRGVVRIYAVTSAANSTYNHTQVLNQDDFARVGSASTNQDGEPGVSVTVAEAAAQSFSNEMVDLGFDDGSTCAVDATDHETIETIEGECMVTTLDGDPVFVGGVEPGLGQDFVSGDFAKSPTFTMTTTSMPEARNLELSLKAGRLPAPIDFEQDQTYQVSAELADKYKSNSLLVGILAVFAVSLVVYGRYRRPEVAVPMVFTGMSEVFLLLGFVAFIQYPLDLSHIAGFIAVIGTGVDDLVIIADEILQSGDVSTGRVFQSRFRKAFWVIGAAAATTIIAMSPLAIIGLGDLSGFAIITIVGVLIGVFITRPAYGDILRNLVLSGRER